MISRERLRHRNRIGKRMVKRYYVWGSDGMDMDVANDPSQVGYLGNTRTPCSCWMCGNPRRKFKKGKERLTLQERRHAEAWKE